MASSFTLNPQAIKFHLTLLWVDVVLALVLWWAVCGCVFSWFGLVTLLILVRIVFFANRTFATKIAGSTALVTGASSGIGEAIAIELARRGVRDLALVARTVPNLEAVAKKIASISNRCNVHIFPCDVSNPEQVQAMAKQVQAKMGTPNIIVNNAGSGQWKHIENETSETALSTIACPYLAAFYVTQCFSSGFVARSSGHILNVTSGAGFLGIRGAVGYQSARWAMRGFTNSLRADLKQKKIGVTLISPFETMGTHYFATAGAESHAMIPYLVSQNSPLAPIVKITTEQVAEGAANSIEFGVREIHTPTFAVLSAFVMRLCPEIMEWSMELGPNGLRPRV